MATKEKVLQTVQNSTDPLTRLQSNYYTQERHKVLKDYYKKLYEAETLEDAQEANEYLEFCLCMLRKQQRNDLTAAAELFFIEKGVMPPAKLALQYDDGVDF